jgi:hypothetical protein
MDEKLPKIEKILEIFKNSDRKIWSAMLENLKQTKDQAGIEIIIRILFEHWDDKSCTWHGIDQCYICEEFNNFFAELGAITLFPLLRKYKSRMFGELTRRNFVFLIGKIGRPEGLSFLIENLKDKDHVVRFNAVIALGQINNEEAYTPLVEVLLKDEDKLIRQVAVEAIANLGLPDRIEPFMVALKDQDDDVRNTAIQVLGILGDTRVLNLLELVAIHDQGKTWLGKAVTLTAIEAIELIKGQAAGDIVLPEMKYSDLLKILAIKGEYFS